MSYDSNGDILMQKCVFLVFNTKLLTEIF